MSKENQNQMGDNEKEAFRLNRLEETNRLKKWAKKESDERIKSLLLDYRNECTRKEIKILTNEENRRRNLK